MIKQVPNIMKLNSGSSIYQSKKNKFQTERTFMKPTSKSSIRKNWIVYGIILLAVIVLAWIFLKPAPAPVVQEYPLEVSPQQTSDLLAKGTFVLDVREPDEWAAGHIAGATLIPLGDLPNRLSEVPQDKEVVVVCRSGRRSAEGRDILRNAGYSLATSMTGGMNAWSAANFPVVSGE
jgi:phage shock protein E